MIEIDFCCIICFLVLLVKKKRPSFLWLSENDHQSKINRHSKKVHAQTSLTNSLSISIHFNMRTRIEPIQLIRIEQLRNKREKKVFVVLAVDGFY